MSETKSDAALIPTLVSESTYQNQQRLTKKKDTSFSQRYIMEEVKEGDCVILDHAYSKNWNSQSDDSHAHTAKYVTWSDRNKGKKSSSIKRSCPEEDELLDVETVTESSETQFESAKAKILMTECERHMRLARPHTSHHSEDPINRSGWTASQNKLFNRVYKVLVGSRMARLANTGISGEPIQRRIYSDKCAKRVRQIFSGVFWDEELLSWLHTTCMDNISTTLLSDYLEVLQTLRAKVPTLIETMITSSDHRQRSSAMAKEALDLLLKRPWDPVTAMPSKGKPEKLPKNPVILIVPQLPQLEKSLPPTKGKRGKLWNNQLSNMAKIKYVQAPNVEMEKITDRWECFDQMVAAIKTAILETKEMYPGKPIILLGWNFGALLAVYVASMEKVSAVVALGYPLLGLNGLRGDADDVIMDSSTPTLFVIGENSQTCPIDDLENMREKMRAENSLIVISGANDRLMINFKTKKERTLTQSIVDRCIIDEIATNLARTLTTPSQNREPASNPASGVTVEGLKKKKTIPNLSNRKVITTIKGLDMKSVPKKRRSPMKDGRPRKAMKVTRNQHIIPISSVQDQMATVTSQSNMGTVIGHVAGLVPNQQVTANVTTSLRNLQPASSSSQESLASLKPISLSIPQLSGSSDTNLATVKLEAIERGQTTNVYPATIHRRDIQTAAGLPAYIQLSGNSGQSYAITMDKARELLNMGVIKGFERSTATKTGEIIGNYETTRQLLSLPPGTPISFTNAAYVGSSSSTHSVTSSRRGSLSNQSSDTNIPSTAATTTTPSTVVTPTTITYQSSAGAQQIRHLLSIDGRLVYPSGSTARSRSVSTNSSPTEKAPATPSPVITVPTTQHSSPGKSLIKKAQSVSVTMTMTSGGSPHIVSAVSRQLMQSPAQENPTNKAISIVLNSNTQKATENTVYSSLTHRNLVVRSPVLHSEVPAPHLVPTAFDRPVTTRGDISSTAVFKTISSSITKPVIIRSSPVNKDGEASYIMRTNTSGSMQWPTHSIVSCGVTSTPSTTVHRTSTSPVTANITTTSTAALVDSSYITSDISAKVADNHQLHISHEAPLLGDRISDAPVDAIQEVDAAPEMVSPTPDVLSIGSSTLSADLSAEEYEQMPMDSQRSSNVVSQTPEERKTPDVQVPDML